MTDMNELCTDTLTGVPALTNRDLADMGELWVCTQCHTDGLPSGGGRAMVRHHVRAYHGHADPDSLMRRAHDNENVGG